VQVAEEMRKGFLGFLVGGDQAMMEALAQCPCRPGGLQGHPLFLPVYIALMGFDQVSGEVGPRSIRYLTVRARRSSLLLGKFLSQATVLLGLVLIIVPGHLRLRRLHHADFAPASFALTC
jgi:ABC-2 type transport system permease protein